jgi:hypothetical protein
VGAEPHAGDEGSDTGSCKEYVGGAECVESAEGTVLIRLKEGVVVAIVFVMSRISFSFPS